MFVYIFLLFGLFMLICVPSGPTQYIFHTPVARYSLDVLKVLLNTNHTNKCKAQLVRESCMQCYCDCRVFDVYR